MSGTKGGFNEWRTQLQGILSRLFLSLYFFFLSFSPFFLSFSRFFPGHYQSPLEQFSPYFFLRFLKLLFPNSVCVFVCVCVCVSRPWILCLLCLFYVEDIKLGFRNSAYTFPTSIPTCMHGFIMFRI